VHPFQSLSPVNSGVRLSFADTGTISFATENAINAKIYELVMDFNYVDIQIENNDSSAQKISWQIFDHLISDRTDGSGVTQYQIQKTSFYNFIKNNVIDKDGVVRKFRSMDFTFYAAGIELYYSYLNNKTLLGLNELYNSTIYTNINGGYGIFSSRSTFLADTILLTDKSLDTLACGHITKHLNFISSPANLNYPGCK
jgi:hypothetical protein